MCSGNGLSFSFFMQEVIALLRDHFSFVSPGEMSFVPAPPAWSVHMDSSFFQNVKILNMYGKRAP